METAKPMVDLGALYTIALYGAVTGMPPLLILIIPYFRPQISDTTLHTMLGLSAGILLGISLLDILPEGLELGEGSGMPRQTVPLAAAAGFFLLLMAEHYLIHAGAIGGHPHEEQGGFVQPFGTLALGALMLHGFTDGFVIPLGFAAGGTVGTVITLAIVLHQIPDSFAAVSVGLGSHRTRRQVALFVLITSVDTPLGVALGTLFAGFGGNFIPVGLGFSAGTFIFVSVADLIPELQHRARSARVVLWIFIGFLAVAGLSFLLPEG